MLRIVEGGRTTQTREDGVPNESVVPLIPVIRMEKYFMLNPEEQDDPYLVFLRCTYTALNDALDANVYTSILAAVIGDIKEPLINARILPLTLEWMRTYLLLRRRGTAKRWKRC